MLVESGPVIFIFGPTASFKTAIGIELAKMIGGEIISADSVQVYRGFNIGSAKPSREEQDGIPHHLVDLCDLNEHYTAYRFCHDAAEVIREIRLRGSIPIVVGGTMMYIYSLQNGLHNGFGKDSALRESLQKEAAESGWPRIHSRLKTLLPQRASKIDPQDGIRIQRAFEILNQPTSSCSNNKSHFLGKKDKILNVMLNFQDRKNLHLRIETRLNRMLESGLIEEVRSIYERCQDSLLNWESIPPLRAPGYAHLSSYFAGRSSLDEAITKTLSAVRQLAKRQITWLKKWPEEQFQLDQIGSDLESLKRQKVNIIARLYSRIDYLQAV